MAKNIRFFIQCWQSSNIFRYFRIYEPIFSFGISLVAIILCLFLVNHYHSMIDASLPLKERYAVVKTQVSTIALLGKKKDYGLDSVDVATSSLKIVLDSFSSYSSSVEKEGKDSVHLHIVRIPFTELVRMLNDVQRISRWVVESIRIDKQADEGEVGVSVSLRLLGKDKK